MVGSGCVIVALVANQNGSVIDGWPVGEEVANCGGFSCDQATQAATDALDARDPGHPAVLRLTFHSAVGVPISTIPLVVAVFRLDDLSVRAIGVIAPVHVPPILNTYDYGPRATRFGS